MMDRLLTAGLCGNTIGQDIQMLTLPLSPLACSVGDTSFPAQSST